MLGCEFLVALHVYISLPFLANRDDIADLRPDADDSAMSALGQKQTYAVLVHVRFTPDSEIKCDIWNVRYVGGRPKRCLRGCATEVPFIFDHRDSGPLCVHETFFKAQSC